MSSKPSNSSAPQAGAFRRQPSLNVSGGNPVLTVAISPASKVDYSVTKGGARTWIVLLVFVLLCSSLHTIFSPKDLEDISDDLNVNRNDIDDDESSNNSGLFSARRMNDDDDDDDRPSLKQPAPPPVAEPDSDDDDDDDDDVDQSLGGRLFASLKKKMSTRLNRKDEDSEPFVRKAKTVKQEQKSKKPKKPEPVKPVEEGDDDDDVDDDDDSDEEEVVEEPAKKKNEKKTAVKEKKEPPKKDVKHKKYVVVSEEDEDDDDDNNEDDDEEEEKKENVKDKDDDDDDEDEDDDEDVKDRDIAENKDEKPEMKRIEAETDSDDDDDDDDDEEDLKLSPREVKKSNRLLKGKRKYGTCTHVDCKNAESAQPRKSLLLKRKRSHSVIGKLLEDEGDDDDNDEGSEEDDDSEEEKENFVEIDDVREIPERTERSAYRRHAITTKEEHGYKDILDRADQLVEKHSYEAAIDLFDHVLANYPYSSRAQFGKARAYDIRGEIELDENDRHRAIAIYEKILENPTTPDALFRQAATRVIDQTRFCGLLHRTLQAHRLYVDKFPGDLKLQTDFGTTFIMMKRYEEARTILKNVIAIDPNNVIALAYYGYILKAQDNQVEQGVSLMRKSLKLADNEIKDPKFYYQLGHGLVSLGKRHEAEQVYSKAAEMGVFLNAQQRSLYNIDGLTARPWWNVDQTPYSKSLKTVERQWATIKLESMSVLRECSECWLDHNQQLVVDGQWKYFPIMSEQSFLKDSCERMPQTCSILRDFRESSNASKSEMYLSVLSSGAKIMPHCGPTNYHLQAHLGLVVPSEARIRVGNETKGWKSGKFVIFDDSFEHELEFDGASSSSFRLVLVLQLWHPGVQSHQRVISFLS